VHHVGILYDQFMMHGQRNIKFVSHHFQKTKCTFISVSFQLCCYWNVFVMWLWVTVNIFTFQSGLVSWKEMSVR